MDINDPSTPYPRPQVERMAALLEPLGDPNRIAILQALRDGSEENVQELADDIEIPHRHASHHALVLHRAGLLERRREGREVFYSLRDWTAWWLVGQAASAVADDDS